MSMPIYAKEAPVEACIENCPCLCDQCESRYTHVLCTEQRDGRMPAMYSVDSFVICVLFVEFQIELPDFIGTTYSGILIADVRRQRRLDQILCDLSRAFA